jgi:speckle-type POZ protein
MGSERSLSVVVGNRVSGPETTACENEIIEVPPSNLSENLGKLLDTKEGADVTFKDKGVVFHAHKAVLTARSPVFKAELYGLIGERKTRHGHLTIQDWSPVFSRHCFTSSTLTH